MVYPSGSALATSGEMRVGAKSMSAGVEVREAMVCGGWVSFAVVGQVVFGVGG